MDSEWFIWCVTNDERKALKLLDRVAVGLNCTPSDVWSEVDEDIPGYSVHFRLAVNRRSWADSVIWLLDVGYRVADSWMILAGRASGSIYESAEGFSDECRTSGVRRIQWHIENPETPNNV